MQGVAGQFPQVAGLRFSFDPARPGLRSQANGDDIEYYVLRRYGPLDSQTPGRYLYNVSCGASTNVPPASDVAVAWDSLTCTPGATMRLTVGLDVPPDAAAYITGEAEEKMGVAPALRSHVAKEMRDAAEVKKQLGKVRELRTEKPPVGDGKTNPKAGKKN